MEQLLVIVFVHENKFGTSVKRKYEFQRIPLSQLTSGAEIQLSETKSMTVIALTDEELSFEMDAWHHYLLNRQWQVLSTVKMDDPDDIGDWSERFIFYFETPVEKAEKGVYKRMLELINVMRENAEDNAPWKNIPLAHEMMHLFKDCTPLRDKEINPVVRMQAMMALEGENLLSKQDLPRLFLSFYAYWEINNELKEKQDGKVNDGDDFAKAIDDNLFKYTWIIEPFMTAELFDKLFGQDQMLRFDLIQYTPEWEKAIYDIEKETDKELKGESRGMGFCFLYWSVKTEKAAQHGLQWRSPHLMNPRVMFD